MAPALHLGRRARLALKIAGFVVLGLIAFVFSLQLTFDYQRVADKYLVEGLASKYYVTLGKVERGIMPGKFSISKVVLESRTTKPDEVPQRIELKNVEADVGVLGLIGGNLDVDFAASIGKGTLTGTVKMAFNGSSFSFSATGSKINGDAIPQLQEAIGLPLLGKVDVSASLDVPGNDWRKAHGSFQVGCPKGCTLGDDKTKFKRPIKNERQAAMMGDGIEFGHIDVDRMLAKLELKNQKLEITKWEWDSKEADLRFELEMKMGKKLKDAELVSGCMKYKALPALISRDARTANALTLIGGIRGPEELYYVKLECQGGRTQCTYSQIKPRSKVCGAGVDAGPDDSGDVAGGITSHVTKPSLGTVTTGSGTVGPEPGADIQPVPTFYDAAPAEPPPVVDQAGSGSSMGSAGNGGSGSGAEPGSGMGSAMGSAGNGGSGGAANTPMLAPGPLRENGNGEVQPEPPPPVNTKEPD